VEFIFLGFLGCFFIWFSRASFSDNHNFHFVAFDFEAIVLNRHEIHGIEFFLF